MIFKYGARISFYVMVCGYLSSLLGEFDSQYHNLFGFSLAEWQNSGSDNCNKAGGSSNWSEWEKNPKHMRGGLQSGAACDWMNQYPEDLAFLKHQFPDMNTLRFSLAWEFIEPQPGEFNEAAFDHYEALCKKCNELGIIPMITLHHFVHPFWFEQLGGFEKEENIVFFTRYAQRVAERLSSYCKLWCPLNEPGVFAMQGYLLKNFPPGHLLRYDLAFNVLCNLMKAHVRCYKTIKTVDESANVLFVHQYLKFVTYHTYNPIEYLPGLLFNGTVHTFIMNFLKTGTFTVPYIDNITSAYTYCASEDIQGDFFDAIGLNYYSRVLVQMGLKTWGPSCYPDETMTAMPYALYSRGFYDAIKDVASCGKPVLITENGIAFDEEQDHLREKFFKEYLHELMRARQDGLPVYGYYCWTAYDNFEWDMTTFMKFGCCYKKDGERFMRPSCKYYADWMTQVARGQYDFAAQEAVLFN